MISYSGYFLDYIPVHGDVGNDEHWDRSFEDEEYRGPRYVRECRP